MGVMAWNSFLIYQILDWSPGLVSDYGRSLKFEGSNPSSRDNIPSLF